MIIRKLFRFEASHIVRNCSSERCRENIHGHSYVAEVFIHSNKLDRGGMVLDFALLDKVKLLIDSIDHSFLLWRDEEEKFKEFIWQNNRRVIELPHSPSSEMISLFLFYMIDRIISGMRLTNGEGDVRLFSVRLHETSTGYAQAFEEDRQLIDFTGEDILFSEEIKGILDFGF